LVRREPDAVASGTTGGDAPGLLVRASATLTLALPKSGLASQEAVAACGDLYLADLGIPAEVFRRIGLRDTRPFDHRFRDPLRLMNA
jgi:NAD(P)H-hydrate epimerase